MSKTTRFNSTGPPNAKVIAPDPIGPDDQAAGIAASMSEIKSVAENPTPSFADDIAASVVRLDA